MSKYFNNFSTFPLAALTLLIASSAFAAGARVESARSEIRADKNREVDRDSKIRLAALRNVEGKEIVMRELAQKGLRLTPDESRAIAKRMLESSQYAKQIQEILLEPVSPQEMISEIRKLSISTDSSSQNQRLLTDSDVKMIMNPARFKLIEAAGISYFEEIGVTDFQINLQQFLRKVTLYPEFSSDPLDLFDVRSTFNPSVTDVISVRFDQQYKLDDNNPEDVLYQIDTSLSVELIERNVTYSQKQGIVTADGNSHGKIADPVGFSIKMRARSSSSIGLDARKAALAKQLAVHLSNLPSSITVARPGEADPILGSPVTRLDGIVTLRISQNATASELRQIINEFATDRN